MNTIEFGNKIAEIRREAGLTQEDLVERVGEEYISLSTLKRIESGQGHIDMIRIMRICKVLGTELSVLLGERNTLRQALEKYYSEPGEEEIQDLYLQEEKYWERFTGRRVIPQSNHTELYFEEPEIDSFVKKLERLYPDIEYVNRLMTHSWGQRVVRFYDLDGNLIEVGTPV